MTPAFNWDLAFAGTEAPTGALFARAEVEAMAASVEAAARDLERARGQGPLAFLDLPYAYNSGSTVFGNTFANTLAVIRESAAAIRAARGQFLHLGIGGSALGAITLLDALGRTKAMNYDCPAEIHVPDNIDPDWIGRILAGLDYGRTFANVVSKSGDTVETIATFAVLWERLVRESGLPPEQLRKRIFVTTRPDRGALAELAAREGFTLLPLPDEIHGRFSVLSPMGLLTAAVAGIDIGQLLEGARRADQDTARASFPENPMCRFAALHALSLRKGLSILVLLPYSNRLKTLADWYSQLVAESLGKDGQGLTPVKALGATDQHSQLQLYNDGPKNKLIVFFSVGRHEEVIQIPPSIASNPAYAHLAGKTLNDLLRAEREATEVSLHLHGAPSCRFELPEVNAFHMGYLLVVLEKTVCLLGRLLGVNAFDQPGVEESKRYAHAMLGKQGEEPERLRAAVAQLLKRPA